jgi:cytochrome c peroxidase
MRTSAFFLCLTTTALLAQGPGGGGGGGQAALRTLRGIPVPEPVGLNEYVRDKAALVALGKVLFWDMQAGSDGVTACATCHFHAGADHRPQNKLVDPQKPFPVNAELSKLEFPLRLLSDPGNRNSTVLRDSSVRVGSAGTFRRVFDGIVLGQAAELGHEPLDTPEFMRDGLQVRRVTTRNSPSVYNTAYYVRNFWDGRATRNFNGFTVTGVDADAPGALVSQDGVLSRHHVRMDRASLAAQAVGPVLDHLEMSYAGRTWPLLGKKMLNLAPLALQRVATDDSVLGALARADGRGLAEQHTYRSLIEAAFERKFWDSAQLVDAAGEPLAGRLGAPDGLTEFSQAEYNFPLFWGLALQAYQSTLNSDASPFDRFMEGDRTAMTPQEQEGMRLFQTTGRCTECHNGPEFSAAAFNVNGSTRIHSFERTGVRPSSEDIGDGNTRFKSIGLRNVEFTGPYFHNGGQATLEQVVDFYRRGGDFQPVTNDIRPFNANPEQVAAIVAFLKALSDDRVRHERAPFDHPELCVPVGHTEEQAGVLMPSLSPLFAASAAEKWREIPAVGAGGATAPLRTFEEMLRGVGAERAHSLTDACSAPLSLDGPAQ